MPSSHNKLKGVMQFQIAIAKLQEGQKVKLVPRANEWNEKNIDVETETGEIIGSIDKELSSKFHYFIVDKKKEYNVKVTRTYPIIGREGCSGVIIEIEDK